MKTNINYKELIISDLGSSALKMFNRYQETNRVWVKENGQCRLADDRFIDQWDEAKKSLVIQALQNCIRCGGFVIGAFSDGGLIGFASVESDVFGSNNEYQELTYIHVSNELRSSGIGKKLFALCCEKGKQVNVKKLYIAAHPSEETQHFYKSVGCTFAAEVNQKIFDKEPLDIQLEVIL